jgi:hypothetical protein
MFDLNEDGVRKAFAKKYKVLGPSVPNIGRILDYGNPMTYFEAWIICDDGEKRPFIFGTYNTKKETQFNILMEIVGDPLRFFQGGILHSTKGEDEKNYTWKDKAPQVFNMVKWNDDLTGDSGSWEPKPFKAWNFIARGNETGEDGVSFNWCIKNNKTQVLSISSHIAKNLVILQENSGNPNDYDINIVKTGAGRTGTKYSIAKPEKVMFPLVVVGDLSAAEQAYVKVNLDTEFVPTSHMDILTHLERKITAISEAMGIDFIGRLYAETGKGPSAKLTSTPSRLVTADAALPTPTAPPVTPVAQAAATPDTDDSAIPTTSGTTLPHRAIATEVTPVSPAASVSTVLCVHCKKDIPDNVKDCPFCNQVVMGPCSSCGFVSSLSLSACPNCKASFG